MKANVVRRIIKRTLELAVMFGAAMAITSMFKIAQVQGNSMNPTLENGDVLLVSAIGKPDDLDIVIADTRNTDIKADYIVKRYYEDKSDENGMWLEGDNKEHSLDSRVLGTFDEDDIIGQALFNFSKLELLK